MHVVWVEYAVRDVEGDCATVERKRGRKDLKGKTIKWDKFD